MEENEMLVQCSKCGEFLPQADFVTDKKSKTRYRTYCKNCRNKENKKRYWEKNREKLKVKQLEYFYNNREKERERNKKYRESHKDKIKEINQAYEEKNKEKIRQNRKEYREKNSKKIKKEKKKYYEENKSSIIQKNIAYEKERKKKDPIYAFKRRIRQTIRTSLKRKNLNKTYHTEEIIGCSIEELISHLKITFYNNYGYEWDEKESVHIDHIIPLKVASTEEETIKLCHWSNLQLLKPQDNLEKSSKENWEINSQNDEEK